MLNEDDMNTQVQWYQKFCEINKFLTSFKFGEERLNATQVIMLREIPNLKKGCSLHSCVAKYGFTYVLCAKNTGIFLRLGLIKITENNEDRRKVDLTLTTKGFKVLRQVETQLSKQIQVAQVDVRNAL